MLMSATPELGGDTTNTTTTSRTTSRSIGTICIKTGAPTSARLLVFPCQKGSAPRPRRFPGSARGIIAHRARALITRHQVGTPVRMPPRVTRISARNSNAFSGHAGCWTDARTQEDGAHQQPFMHGGGDYSGCWCRSRKGGHFPHHVVHDLHLPSLPHLPRQVQQLAPLLPHCRKNSAYRFQLAGEEWRPWRCRFARTSKGALICIDNAQRGSVAARQRDSTGVVAAAASVCYTLEAARERGKKLG